MKYLIRFSLFFLMVASALSIPAHLSAQHTMSLNFGSETTYLHRPAIPGLYPFNFGENAGLEFSPGFRGAASWTNRFSRRWAFQLGVQVAWRRLSRKEVYSEYDMDLLYESKETNVGLFFGFLRQNFDRPNSLYLRFGLVNGINLGGELKITSTFHSGDEEFSLVDTYQFPLLSELSTSALRLACGWGLSRDKFSARIGPYTDIGLGVGLAAAVVRGQTGVEMEIDLFRKCNPAR